MNEFSDGKRTTRRLPRTEEKVNEIIRVSMFQRADSLEVSSVFAGGTLNARDNSAAPVRFEGNFTRESHLHDARSVFASRLNEPEKAKALAAKLLYGTGDRSVYGTCHYGRWLREQTHEVIEISAFAEESLEQLWVTLAHELAHVLAGWEAGHGPSWKAAAKRLGFMRPLAVGPARVEDLDPQVAMLLRSIPRPQDGRPINETTSTIEPVRKTRPGCPLGIGTAGGTSRGPGSGSRLRLYVCECEEPVRVRVASDNFLAQCMTCSAAFKRK